MSNFKSRLLEEKVELSDKIVKLGLFLDGDKVMEINPIQASLLGIQHLAMQTYERCLAERIANLDKQPA